MRLLIIGVTGVAVALLVGGAGFYQALTVSTDRTLDREALSSAHEVAVLVDEGRLPDAVPTSGAQLVQVVDGAQRVLAASLGADRLVPLLNPAQLQDALGGTAVLVDGARFGSSGPLRVRAVAAGPQDAPGLRHRRGPGRGRARRPNGPADRAAGLLPRRAARDGRGGVGGHGPDVAPGRGAPGRGRAHRR